MSTVARITGAEFDPMVEQGAFDRIGPKKVELIHGGGEKGKGVISV